MKRDRLKLLQILVIIAFVVSLVPVLWISFYSHPLFDDYSYSIGVHKAIMDGASLVGVVGAALSEVANTYITWQGTYSAIFLFALQPGVYSVPIYWLTAFILIGSLVISNIILSKTVICKVLKGRSEIAVIVALLISAFQIHFVPYIKEAFYWYNGGMYYTFFYSLMVIEWAAVLSFMREEKNKIGAMIGIILLGIFISGGNYSTALINVLVIGLATIVSLIKNRKKSAFLITLTVVVMGSFAVSMLAPGNSVRATQYHSLTPVQAVVESIKYAAICIARWTRLQQIGLIILLAVCLAPILRKAQHHFSVPLLKIAFAFGIFAAQATPPLYAMNSVGGLREINMYHYSYYLLMAFVVLEVEGWLIEKLGAKTEKVGSVVGYVSVGCAAVLVAVGTFMFGLKYTAFFTTFLDLKSGRAQHYDAEYKRIVALIEESDGTVYTTDINEWPNSFYRLDLRPEGDIGYWINNNMAQYFGVDAIILKED